MQFLRIIKHSNSKVEQARTLLLVFCTLSDIKLSKTELTVLSYFLVYGISEQTRKLILDSSILKSEDSLKNTISKLKKEGLIHKPETSRDYLLNSKIDLKPDPVMGLLIKIDNREQK